MFPHFLAFFNGLRGGPALGYRHLVDSSLDWGQGLPALKEFIDREVADAAVLQHGTQGAVAGSGAGAGGARRLNFYVSYFGLGNPPYYNISDNERYAVMHLHSSVSGVSRPKHVQEVNIVLQEGFYCIGASMLQPVYNNHAPGNWNAHYEGLYRRQARFLLRLLTLPDPMLTPLVSGQLPELHDMPKMLNWIDGFRLGRLCAFFRETTPYAQPAYAFNVYKVGANDLRRFLLGPAPAETSANDMTFLRVALR